jgi:uncharacterized Zn-finger protein
MQRTPANVLAAALIAATVSVAPARAQTRPTLSGTWSASPLVERWNIGQWGDKCGPRPSPQGAPGGTVTITQTGNELTISGAGRSYSTTNCWEQMPGLSRTSHSASARGWSNRCTTAAGDPRQATIVTTISATDDAISFDETGSYVFVLEGQNCTAAVRRTRSFKLVQRLGEPPPAETAPASATTTTTPPPPATATATEEPAHCDSPGDPARIEVRPARKLMRPGEEFVFRARVADSAGCTLKAAPTWRVAGGAAKFRVEADGKVVVAPDSPEGKSELVVSISGQNVKVTVEVATADHYDALLASSGLNARGETDDAAVAVLATGSLGGGASVAEDGARKRKWIFAGVVGSLATFLAVAGLALLRRGGRKRLAPADDDADRPASGRAQASVRSEPGRPRQRLDVSEMGRAGAAMEVRCPVCGKTFPSGALYCPHDGTRLVRTAATSDPSRAPVGGFCPTCERGFPPDVKYCPEHHEALVPAPLFRVSTSRKQQPFPEKKGKICPTCGARYDAEATFCGKDGTALVLVN